MAREGLRTRYLGADFPLAGPPETPRLIVKDAEVADLHALHATLAHVTPEQREGWPDWI